MQTHIYANLVSEVGSLSGSSKILVCQKWIFALDARFFIFF